MASKPFEVIQLYFKRKQMNNLSYSMRAFARDLKISPSYLSGILSGKKKFPTSKTSDFIKILDLDDVACLQLRRALDTSTSISKITLDDDDKSFLKKYVPLPRIKINLLKHWYYVALLDLTTVSDFKNDPHWISKKLGISLFETTLAIENLKRLGLLKEDCDSLVKVNKKIRFPTNISQKIVRDFHTQMIKKSLSSLKLTDEDSFQNRLIAGATFAIAPHKIQDIKRQLNELLLSVTESATEGECLKVYQFNLQFFPLSK